MTNYSYDTSLPAYNKNSSERLRQEAKVENQIKLLKHNACIKLIAQNLNLPDATISARINDLIDKGKAEYYGKGKIDGMKRKLVRLIQPIQVEEQTHQITMF